jgi:hypothetical protein
MPQFTGYFSGVKDAADMVRQKQADLDIHAERLQMMAMRNQDMAKQSQEMEQQKAEENLLKKSFGAKQTDANIQEDSNNKQSLVDKFMSAGQSMMEINPTKGIAMIKEAEALQQGKSESDLKSLQLVAIRHEAMAQVAIGINDQESLNTAIPELAKTGTVIPPKYRVWNEETKNWLGQRVKGSKTAKEALELDLKVGAAALAAKKEQNLEANRKVKAQLAERRLAALRTPGTKTYKDPSENTIYNDITELKGLSEGFDDLSSKHQVAAAKDYNRRAYYYQTQGISDPVQAFAMAKEDILNNISEEGEYLGFTVDKKDTKNTGNVESTFKSDPDMKGFNMGNKTNKGYEVLDKSGKVVGYYN